MLNVLLLPLNAMYLKEMQHGICSYERCCERLARTSFHTGREALWANWVVNKTSYDAGILNTAAPRNRRHRLLCSTIPLSKINHHLSNTTCPTSQLPASYGSPPQTRIPSAPSSRSYTSCIRASGPAALGGLASSGRSKTLMIRSRAKGQGRRSRTGWWCTSCCEGVGCQSGGRWVVSYHVVGEDEGREEEA
jgi:hypothetical protein